jgi:peroxiredoxin Q/BCP
MPRLSTPARAATLFVAKPAMPRSASSSTAAWSTRTSIDGSRRRPRGRIGEPIANLEYLMHHRGALFCARPAWLVGTGKKMKYRPPALRAATAAAAGRREGRFGSTETRGDPMLQKGDHAPDFELSDQNGEPVRLGTVLSKGPVVLFFYPAALSPGCTREACHFRDIVAEFAERSATILGISADRVDKQKRFDDTHKLGYPLLADTDGAVAKAYGLKRLIPGFPAKRATFVIGGDQQILAAIHSEVNMNIHANEALEALAG